MPDSDDSTWQPGDDPLANLPEPAGSAVAQWRSDGLGDTKIRSLVLTAASWDGADGQIARLDGHPVPPPGPWQRALHELRRRDTVNRDHETAEARRLSDALDAALTGAIDAPADPPVSGPATPPAASGRPKVPIDRRKRAQWLTDWLIALWREQPPERPNLSRSTLNERWRTKLEPAGVKWSEVVAIYKKHEEMRGKPGKRNRPA